MNKEFFKYEIFKQTSTSKYMLRENIKDNYPKEVKKGLVDVADKCSDIEAIFAIEYFKLTGENIYIIS